MKNLLIKNFIKYFINKKWRDLMNVIKISVINYDLIFNKNMYLNILKSEKTKKLNLDGISCSDIETAKNIIVKLKKILKRKDSKRYMKKSNVSKRVINKIINSNYKISFEIIKLDESYI